MLDDSGMLAALAALSTLCLTLSFTLIHDLPSVMPCVAPAMLACPMCLGCLVCFMHPQSAKIL